MTADKAFDQEPGLPFEHRLTHPGMAELYSYWRRLGHGRAPVLRTFDPISVPRLLPDLQITRRDPNGRYRIGLTGENVAALVGANHTGRYLDEVLPAASYPSRSALYDAALDGGSPIAYRSFLILKGRECFFQKRLLLPFVDEGARPDAVLAMALLSNVPKGDVAPIEGDGIIEILRSDAV